jgi:hypothetical protein
VRRDLALLALVAERQGKHRVQAICLAALARLDELEARLDALEAHLAVDREAGRRGGFERAARLTSERRHAIALLAAVARWQGPDA